MSRNKKLNIIITNSFQNDFIEPVDDLLNQVGDNLKLTYEACTQKWIEYFKTQKRNVDDSTIEEFISSLKRSQSSGNGGPLSYHKILQRYKHRVHLNYEETKRIWGNGELNRFITDIMKKAEEANNSSMSDTEYQLIHLRDWHDLTDPEQKPEMNTFGYHCVKGTQGAKFASPLNDLIEENREFNTILNSNNISSFDETNLEPILDALLMNTGNSKRTVNIGLFGVVTNVKIQLITFELKVIHKYENVTVCGDFCGGFNNAGHKAGIALMTEVFGSNVVNYNRFREIFGI